MSIPSSILPLEPLLNELASRNFLFGVDSVMRVQQYWNYHWERGVDFERLRYELAALLCRSPEQQEIFLTLFDRYGRELALLENPASVVKPPVPPKPPAEPKDARSAGPVKARGAQQNQTGEGKPGPSAARPGPFRIELSFEPNPVRMWNLEDLDRVMPALREKEWSEAFGWDLNGSIRATIRAGGVPTLVRRQRRRSPRYLLLIEQRSHRDHLAAFFAGLSLELNRRDLEADFYFYENSPDRCWKDRRDLRTYVSIEQLHAEWSGARLLLIGEAGGLLSRPYLEPSARTRTLLESWPQTALLCTKASLEWGRAEAVLAEVMPVVPAHAAGLARLPAQWKGLEMLDAAFWQRILPEPGPPKLTARTDADINNTLVNLYHYLGHDGYKWLCATALYPEVYPELTALFHDEVIPVQGILSEWQQNDLWWQGLRHLSLLDWFRQGHVPTQAREILTRHLSVEEAEKAPDAALRESLLYSAREARRELLKLLQKDINQPPPDSYAASDRVFNEAWLRRDIAGGDLEDYLPQDIALTDIEDPLGRQVWQRHRAEKAETAAGSAGFQVLWVDDHPENNQSYQDAWTKELGLYFQTVSNTSTALDKLQQESFQAVISDLGRRDDTGGGGRELLRGMLERKIACPFAIFTNEQGIRLKKELLEAGAELVTASAGELLGWLRERLEGWKAVEGGKEAGEARSAEQQKVPQYQAYTQALFKIKTRDNIAGVGFLTEGGYLFTASFLLPDQIMARDLTLQSPYFPDVKFTPVPEDFIEDATLGFTRIKIDFSTENIPALLLNPGDPNTAGSFSIPFIGGENGQLHISPVNALASVSETEWRYETDTPPGSAGAPIVDEKGNVVGIHLTREGDAGSQSKDSNTHRGLRISAVLEAIFKVEENSVYYLGIKVDEEIKKWGEDHVDVAVARITLAKTLLRQGYFNQAENLLSKALEAHGKNTQPDGQTIATMQDMSVSIIRTMGGHDRARDFLKEVLSRELFATPVDRTRVADLQKKLEEVEKEITNREEKRKQEEETERKKKIELEKKLQEEKERKRREQAPKEPPPAISKEKIQQLIASGQTEEALALLVRHKEDAILLQGRYNNGKKQFNNGLLEFSEWQRVQAQVNYAMLELANTLPRPGVKLDISKLGDPPSKKPGYLVAYITYAHADRETTYRVREYLRNNNIDVLTDADLPPGESINDFMEDSLRTSKVFVPVISAKSFQSSLFGKEIYTSILAESKGGKFFIPVQVEPIRFDKDFQKTVQKNLLTKIAEIDSKISELHRLGEDSRSASEELHRFREFRENLDFIMDRLKQTPATDISGENFEPGMQKVVERINKQFPK